MRLCSLLLVLAAPVAAQSFTALESPAPVNSGAFGTAVATGDVAGDAREEVIVGTREGDEGAGRVYVFASNTLVQTLAPPAPEPDGSFGEQVAVAGDADGDGRDDVYVCAPNEDPGGIDRAGQLHVFSGMTGGLVRSIASPNPEVEGFFCSQIARVGDLDGDGRADVLVAAVVEGPINDGRVYALAAATGGVLHTLVSPAPLSTSDFGAALADAGDQTGDGVPDLLVGAPGETVNGLAQAGQVHLYNGATGALVRTYRAPTPVAAQRYGQRVAVLPDASGDGRPDFVVAAYNPDGTAVAAVAVVSGANGALLRALPAVVTQTDAAYGASLATVPDVTGDGVTDILVGAPERDASFQSAGSVFLFNGATGALADTYTSPNAGFISRFGWALAATSDSERLLVMAARSEAAPAFASGRVYLRRPGGGTAAEGVPVPSAPTLHRPYPNPTAAGATLRFDLPAASLVRLEVFDVRGRAVAALAEGPYAAGSHTVAVDGHRWAAGLYLVRLTTPGAVRVVPMGVR